MSRRTPHPLTLPHTLFQQLGLCGVTLIVVLVTIITVIVS